MKKNEIYEFDIIDNGMNLEGIAKLDGITVFIDGAITGEKVMAKIIKVTKTFAVAKLTKIITPSKYRQTPKCKVAGKCGGCSCQHIDYKYTTILKTNQIKNSLEKSGLDNIKLNECVIMENPYNYRNKVAYPIRVDKILNTKIGFYLKGSHDIIENEGCVIQSNIIDEISKKMYSYLLEYNFLGYDEIAKEGDIRHIVIRQGQNTEELMIVIVVNKNKLLKDERFKEIVKIMVAEYPIIKSVVLNLNSSTTNEILGEKQINIFGNGYITEKLGDIKYYISPKSFFQVNTTQAEKLYNLVLKKLELKGTELLFDLYSGVGSIGIFLSKYCKSIYGIEIEPEAVEMANMNIELNNIKNAEYLVGSVEDRAIEFKKRKITPDAIVVDPPRKGLDTLAISHILNFSAKKIVYVSCNPATLARDLKELSEKYDVIDITPVDMFCWTTHVESVVLLQLK